MKKIISPIILIMAIAATGTALASHLPPAHAASTVTADIYLDNPSNPDYDGAVEISITGKTESGALLVSNISYVKEQYMQGIPATVDIIPGEYEVTASFIPCKSECDACKGSYKLTNAYGEDITAITIKQGDNTIYLQFVSVNTTADEVTDIYNPSDKLPVTENEKPNDTITEHYNQNAETEDYTAAESTKTTDEETGALAPAKQLLSKTGKSLSNMWISIIVLTTAGISYLLIYLRRKSLAIKGDE